MTAWRQRGNLDQAVVGDAHADLGFVLGHVQPQRLRVLARYVFDLDDMCQRLGHGFGRTGVERHDLPLLGEVAVLGDRGAGAARFDRQQLQHGGRAGLVHQLRRAHGGAPGARGQHPAAEVREEDRVDELGFAA